MTLFRHGIVETDDWIFPADDAPLPTIGRVAVPKARFIVERAALLEHPDPIGIVLVAGDDLDGIVADLARLTLIALRFPRYTDGRPYSLARMLRDRHGFAGEIRATGNVLRDQVAFILRAGFDALDVTHPGTVAALRAGQIVAVNRHYQPASRETAEDRPGGRPWLRRTTGLAAGV